MNDEYNKTPMNGYPSEQDRAAQSPDDLQPSAPSSNGYTVPKQTASSSQTSDTTMHSTYGGYGYNYQAQMQKSYPAANQPAPFSVPVPNSPAPQRPQKKKEKKKSGRMSGAIVAVCLACALVGGGIGTTTTYLMLSNQSASSDGSNSSQNASGTTVNIDEKYNSSVEAIADKVLPSVVGIQASYKSSGFTFGESSSSISEGSGIIYKENGYIITNYHVISNAIQGGSIRVFFNGDDDTSEGAEATVVGYDASADLAVIKVDRTGLTPIEIGDSSQIKVGQVSVAIGNPGGLQFMGSVSQGIVSGLNRSVTLESGVEMNLIQTDAAINPGNSGGALVDGTGKLIGVNSAKLGSTSSSVSYEGMGFAIPVDDVVEICDRLIQNEGQKTPYIGVTVDRRYTAEVLQQMGYPTGVVVSTVLEDSPASQAGLQASDILLSMDGVELTSYEVLSSEIAKHAVGDKVTLEVYRLGQTISVEVALGETSGQ